MTDNIKVKLDSEILKGLTTSVIWLDKQENVRYINEIAAELLQLNVIKTVGVNWRYILPKLLDEINSCGTGSLTIHDYEINFPNGDSRVVTCTISYFEISGMEGSLIEMYDTKRLFRIAEEDERSHQYEASKLLVKTLAHEIKNPLAGIYGAAQLLRKKTVDDEKSGKFLDIITNEVKRLKNLVDQMLGPSKNRVKEPYDIHSLLNYVLEVIDAEKLHNISIRLDYDTSIPDINLDFESMVQAVLNIVKNAVQAMQLHGGLLTLKTRIESSFTLDAKSYPLVAVISVTDQGIGIPKDIEDNIFFPMVSSKKEGTGIGLSVAQDVVRHHDGLIVAQSTLGETTFKIFIPIQNNV